MSGYTADVITHRGVLSESAAQGQSPRQFLIHHHRKWLFDILLLPLDNSVERRMAKKLFSRLSLPL